MGERVTPAQREEGRRIKAARVAAELEQEEVAAALGKHRMTISRWERGASAVPAHERGPLSTALRVAPATLWPTGKRGVSHEAQVGRVRETPAPYDTNGGWPKGWNARAYRLQLEAAEAGATEEEISTVRGWMLDPQVQAMWSGGSPKADQLKSLDGIEIGARAWLRARGRMVRAK